MANRQTDRQTDKHIKDLEKPGMLYCMTNGVRVELLSRHMLIFSVSSNCLPPVMLYKEFTQPLLSLLTVFTIC